MILRLQFDIGGQMATEAQVTAVKQRRSLELLRQPGVQGVGVERDDAGGFVLAIHVDANQPSLQIPGTIDGVPVRLIRGGPFRKVPARTGPAKQ